MHTVADVMTGNDGEYCFHARTGKYGVYLKPGWHNEYNVGDIAVYEDAIHGHINDFLVRTGLRSGVSELQLPCFTAVRAEIALMSGSAFAVTHHPVSS
ncbi:tail fiber protein [Shigella sonnei]|nr:tail fiber protein [Shigella sonnei]